MLTKSYGQVDSRRPSVLLPLDEEELGGGGQAEHREEAQSGPNRALLPLLRGAGRSPV